MAESGRTRRETLGPYELSDFLDRTTTASIAVGYFNKSTRCAVKIREDAPLSAILLMQWK